MLIIRSIGQVIQKLSYGKKRKLTFGCCDLALDPMTFTSELDLPMVVTYLHVKNLVKWVKQFKSYHLEKKIKLLAAVTLHLTP